MLLSCTYVNDICSRYLERYWTNSFLLVPAQSFALPFGGTFDCADMPAPDAHLLHVGREPSRHAHGPAQRSTVALELPRELDVAEVLHAHADLPHCVFELLLVLAPLCVSPTGECGVDADRAVFVVTGLHAQRTLGFAQAVRHLQHLTAAGVVSPAGDRRVRRHRADLFLAYAHVHHSFFQEARDL